MDDSFTEIVKPLRKAIVVFIGLLVALSVSAAVLDLSRAEAKGLLFLAFFVVSILVAKSVYDSNSAKTEEENLRRQITDDITVSMKDLYTKLYQNSPVPYLLINYEGIVTSANVAASRLLGVPQKKAEGLNIFGRLHTESLDHLDLIIEKFHNNISVNNETVQVQMVDGSNSWALLSLFNFIDGFGEHMGMLTLVDITKQKQIENAKSEFVSLASHQLRTPIAGMRWSAELLQTENAGGLTDKQHKYVDRLLTGVNRMGILVDDFLRVSRFELGTFQPEYKPVDLTILFENIILEQELMVKKKNIEIKTFFDKKIKTIVTDQNLLRMILSNLYSNAVKYTRVGGTIHIGFSHKDDQIDISIADNGMGIPINEQDQIFSKLFRASNAVRDIPDGTGLGLYIVKEAVRVLHGRISFNSTENVGTTFEVVLPYQQEETN